MKQTGRAALRRGELGEPPTFQSEAPMIQIAANKPNRGMPTAEPVDLANLLAVVPESVVSRTLVKRGGGTVTLFAFDRGQGLSEHTAPFDALVLVLDGRVELTIGGEKLSATTGQSVLMPANVPHALQAIEPFKMLLVMIREPAAAPAPPREG